jgi:hypothetical protein
MPIRPFLAGRTFEPVQITIMSAAFADTCKALGLRDADHPLTPLVAQHLMGLGERGVRSRTVLYLLTLEQFRRQTSTRSLTRTRRSRREAFQPPSRRLKTPLGWLRRSASV